MRIRPFRTSPIACVIRCVVALVAASSIDCAADEAPVNLTRLSTARVEATTAPGGGASAVAALFDGDPATSFVGAASAKSPLDVVLGFGGAIVAPERIRVRLSAGPAELVGCEVEILASAVSPIAGFRTLRTDPLKPDPKPQEFAFPAVAAKFVLLRFRPAPGVDRIAVAEVEVVGHEGEPRSRYAFAESPAKAFDVLARLEAVSSLRVTATPEEVALFRRAKEGPLDDATFADAALLASGALDAAQRASYRKRLDALTAEARAAVGSASGLEAKGDALLRWLHAGPMKKGYVSEQTDLSVLLDTATFNCVSSAILYAIVARRLGLDARGIEVPDHAFSIVYEGTNHVDVETTNALGFNPARNKTGLAAFEKATGFRYIADSHRDKRREVDSAGLAAIVYYNHGVLLGRAGRHHEALLSYFRAMSLDPEFGSAVKNAMAELANWGVALSKKGEFESALEVVRTGLALAPADALLRSNRDAIWSRWVETTTDAGKPVEAVALVRRAIADVPGGPFDSMLSWPYLKPAEERAKASKWEESLSMTDAALATLDGKARDDVVSWRIGVRNRWTLAEANAGRFASAAAVLEKALAESPGDGVLQRNAAWLAQEWAVAIDASDGPAALAALVKDLVARFPGVPAVAKAGASVTNNKVVARLQKKEWAEALAATTAGADLLEAKARDDLTIAAYDGWAKDRIASKSWSEAADVYVKALAAVPSSSLIRNNVIYLAQLWSQDVAASKGPDAVATLRADLAARFPSIPEVGRAGALVTRNAIIEHLQARRWSAALDGIASAADLLEKKEREELTVGAYDGWAGGLAEQKKWTEAADVYAKGLLAAPKSSQLENNVVFLAQEWAKSEAAANGAIAAVDALRSMRGRFPEIGAIAATAKQTMGAICADLVAKGRYEDAVAAAVAAATVLDTDKEREEVLVRTYERWAAALEKTAAWEDAVAVWAKALERLRCAPSSSKESIHVCAKHRGAVIEAKVRIKASTL